VYGHKQEVRVDEQAASWRVGNGQNRDLEFLQPAPVGPPCVT
jgi:hypothetical protein